MSTAFTPAAVDQLVDDVEGAGLKFTGTYTSSGLIFTTTDPEPARGGDVTASTRFKGAFAFFPSATSANKIRQIVSHTTATGTATFTTTGPNYNATGTSVVGYLLFEHSDILRNYANDALEHSRVEVRVPLMHGPASGDMQGDDVDTDWTETNATDTVQTTSSEVFQNAQSLVVTDSGSAGGYTQSALERIGQGRTVTMFGIVKSDTGTSTLIALDGSGNEQDSVLTTQEEWMLLKKRVTFDAADEQIRLRLEGTTASAEGDWQAAWYVKEDVPMFSAPAWFTERHRIIGIQRKTAMIAGSEADTWYAGSGEYVSLRGNDDPDPQYKVYRYGADASRWQIAILDKSLLTEPLYILVDAPWSAPYGTDATFSSDTSTTNMPQDEFMAAWKVEIAKAKNEFDPVTKLFDRGKFPGLHSAALNDLAKVSRTQENPQPATEQITRNMFGAM